MAKGEEKDRGRFKALQLILQGALLLAGGLVALYVYLVTGTNLVFALMFLAGGIGSIWYGKKFF